MKHIKLFENYSTIRNTLEKRISNKYWDEFITENELDREDQNDDYWFDIFLEEYYSITISDEFDIIQFSYLDQEIKELIGELPILLYHYTSSNLIDSIIENGLVGGYVKTNEYENSYSGVYLTCQESIYENAVKGYVNKAIEKHGGEGVRIYLKMFLNEIEPDTDDEGLSSGESQFISKNIPKNRILKIEKVI